MGPKHPLLAWVLALVAVFSACAILGAKPTEKQTEEVPAIITAKPLKEAPGDDELQKLLKGLYNERLALVAGEYWYYQTGRAGKVDELLDAARRLMRTGMELHDKSKDKIDLLTHFVELSNKVEMLLALRVGIGADKESKERFLELERQKLRAFKLEMEIQMLRVKKAGEK
jgi:hypothetical protein